MTIAQKLNGFLSQQQAEFELIPHDPTKSSLETAKLCRIPAGQMAKAILLDTEQDYMLAVLAANRRIELAELRSDLGLRPRLVKEDRVGSIFSDCDLGAIPPMGAGYGVETIIDDSLEALPDVYFEAGDHTSLVHMSGAEFSRLTQDARHGHFSASLMH